MKTDPNSAVKVFKNFHASQLRALDWYQNIEPYIKATLLYGSVAKGTNHEDSDIDILFILPLEIEELYTDGEYFFDHKGYQVNIVIRSIERLRQIAQESKDVFQKEVFRRSIIISSNDDEVRCLLAKIERIDNQAV